MNKNTNELLNTHSISKKNDTLIKECEKKLNLIVQITLAFQLPTFLFYMVNALSDSENYAPYLFKSIIQIGILYILLQNLKKGSKPIAILILLGNILSLIYIPQMFELMNKNSIIGAIAIYFLASALWGIFSMSYVIFDKDMKNYLKYKKSIQ